MPCPICDDFERALKDRTSEYRQACSNTVYCRISSRFVAYSEIEMSRAKSELEIHRSVCASAAVEDCKQSDLAKSGFEYRRKSTSGILDPVIS
jgi:hypothetical protein